jgi:hypothetical protein
VAIPAKNNQVASEYRLREGAAIASAPLKSAAENARRELEVTRKGKAEMLKIRKPRMEGSADYADLEWVSMDWIVSSMNASSFRAGIIRT